VVVITYVPAILFASSAVTEANQRVDAVGRRVRADRLRDKRSGSRRGTLPADGASCRVEPGHATAVGRDDVSAVGQLEDVVRGRDRQARGLVVGHESIAIEPAEALRRAEPQEPARVGDNALDAIVTEAIALREAPDGQPLG